MKPWSDHALVRQWQQLTAGRRASLKAALWGCGLLVIHQLLWLPGQARLLQAERSLVAERETAARLQRIMHGPQQQGVSVRLTPAGLSECARDAGIHVAGLEARAGQVDISLEGPVATVLPWLHQLEREGGRMLGIQLQVEGQLLHARLVVELAES